MRQWSLSLQIQLQTDKKAFSSRHTFSFRDSPLPDLKIDSGYVEVNVGEAEGIKKLLGLTWNIQFDNENDAA